MHCVHMCCMCITCRFVALACVRVLVCIKRYAILCRSEPGALLIVQLTKNEKAQIFPRFRDFVQKQCVLLPAFNFFSQVRLEYCACKMYVKFSSFFFFIAWNNDEISIKFPIRVARSISLKSVVLYLLRGVEIPPEIPRFSRKL